jgi:hypothetical protein
MHHEMDNIEFIPIHNSYGVQTLHISRAAGGRVVVERGSAPARRVTFLSGKVTKAIPPVASPRILRAVPCAPRFSRALA